MLAFALALFDRLAGATGESRRALAPAGSSSLNNTGAKAWNENPKPFIWTKSTDEIFASMQKYLGQIVSEQTSEEGH